MLDQSRPPPPRVAPVTKAGVRYEQVKNARSLGFDQVSGYLAAVDEKTGQRLWVLRIYDNQPVAEIETDVQETYFREMTLSESGELRIVNEAGGTFLVDLENQTVRSAD